MPTTLCGHRRSWHRSCACLMAVAITSCNAPSPSLGTGSEFEVRARLQQQLDTTWQLEVLGRAVSVGGKAIEIAAAVVWQGADAGPATEATVTPEPDGHFRAVLLTPFAAELLPAPRLHVIDRDGAHWLAWLDLSKVPVRGSVGVGDVIMTPVAAAAGGLIVDMDGTPQQGARVLLVDGDWRHRRTFETTTDTAGRFWLCQALPLGEDPSLIVRAAGFPPLRTPLAARTALPRGGEVRGRVLLPPGVDGGDVRVVAWMDEPWGQVRDDEAVFAEVSCAVGEDGSFALRGVPCGRQRLRAIDRATSKSAGPEGSVEVQTGAPTTCPDLLLWADARTWWPLHLRLVDDRGRPITATEGWLSVSDVGVRCSIRDGSLDWVAGPADEPIGFEIPGYEDAAPRRRATGETVVLGGGHRLAFRLALSSALQMPPGSQLELRLQQVGINRAIACERPILFEDAEPGETADGGSVLRLDRDALVTVAGTGNYAVHLALRFLGGSRREVSVQPEVVAIDGKADRALFELDARFGAYAPPAR